MSLCLGSCFGEGYARVRDYMRADVRYNPIIDAELRWSDWDFALTFIRNGTEYIDIEGQKFHLDARFWGSRWPAGVAHGIAHLDLGHHLLDLDHLRPRQECSAASLATRRLLGIWRT